MGNSKVWRKMSIDKIIYNSYDHILPTKSHGDECTLRDGEYKPKEENYEF